MPDRYAVIGNPIAHSKSPRIHAAFALQTGQDLVYDKILGGEEGFEQDVRAFIDGGGLGLNVTLPFKERAWQLADRLSDGARQAGAVNTLILTDGGGLLGANTDGIGLVRDLVQNHGLDLHGSRILLLGAGGASRGILGPLLEQLPERLVIANRTVDKAHRLCARFAYTNRIAGCGLTEIAGLVFDLIINGTSAGLGGKTLDIPAGALAAGGLTYDLMYAKEATDFVRWGRAQGAAQALDGLGMLVEQAAESFYLWRGVRPQSAPVIAMLRQ